MDFMNFIDFINFTNFINFINFMNFINFKKIIEMEIFKNFTFSEKAYSFTYVLNQSKTMPSSDSIHSLLKKTSARKFPKKKNYRYY